MLQFSLTGPVRLCARLLLLLIVWGFTFHPVSVLIAEGFIVNPYTAARICDSETSSKDFTQHFETILVPRAQDCELLVLEGPKGQVPSYANQISQNAGTSNHGHPHHQPQFHSSYDRGGGRCNQAIRIRGTVCSVLFF
jgi:hypothetical protein